MKYGALTIDTSVFDHYGLSLDTEPLRSLDQFRGKPVGLVLCDVVVRELTNHLVKKVEDQAKVVAKASRVMRALRLDSGLADSIDQATSKISAPQVASEQLEGFLAATGAVELSAADHVKVGDLLVMYFDSKPPFASSGPKKSEFPDAICLMALESYAKSKAIKLLAVSGDGDWVDFAAHSDWIDVERNLPDALGHFQAQADAYRYCHEFIGSWQDAKYSSLMDDIQIGVEEGVQNWRFQVDAQSPLSWEADDLEVSLEGVELIEFGDPERDIKIINVDDDSVTFRVTARLFFSVEAAFSLSVYDSLDKDYTSLGGCSARTELEVLSEVFVKISGDVVGPLQGMQVETVDATPTGSLMADFGYLEPDWHEDDYE